MKQFKRVMAMLLTLVMTLGLFAGLTLPASAADVTLAYWGKVSIAANTDISASSYQGSTAPKLRSNKAMTIAGTNCYYGSSAGGAEIVISGLPSGYKTKQITFYTRASQQGTMAVSYSTNNGSTYTTISSPSITKSEALKTVTLSTPVENVTNIKFKHSVSSGSLYFGTVTISGEAAATKTLESISVSGQKTSFAYNEEFSFGGTVTAHYTDSTTEDVTASATFSPTVGTALTASGTATVSYNGKSASYSYTVAAPTPGGTITYVANGTTLGTDSNLGNAGATTTLRNVATDVSGYTFVGWLLSTEGDLATNNTTAPSTNYYAKGGSYTLTASNVTFNAVYTKTEGGSGTRTYYKLVDSITTGNDYIFATSNNATSAGETDVALSVTPLGTTAIATSTDFDATGVSIKAEGTDYIIETSATDIVWNASAALTAGSYSGFRFKNGENILRLYGSGIVLATSENNNQIAFFDNGGLYGRSSSGSGRSTYSVKPGSDSGKLQVTSGTSTSSRLYAYEKTTVQSGTTYYTTSPVAATTTRTLTLVSDHGTVSDGTNNLTIGAHTYENGDMLELTATAASGWRHTGWTVTNLTEDTDYTVDSTTKALTIEMNADTTVTAVYAQEYTITANSTTNGSITNITTSPEIAGEEVMFEVTAASGFEIGTVTANSGAVTLTPDSSNTPTYGIYTFTMPASNVTISATFTAATVALDINQVAAASIENGAISSITVDGVAANTTTAGKTVTVTVTPDEGYICSGVTYKEVTNTRAIGDTHNATKVNDTTYTFTMPENAVEVSATFRALQTYTVTFYAYEGATAQTVNVTEGSSIGTANVPSEGTVDGYTFQGWYAGTYDDTAAPASGLLTKQQVGAVVPADNSHVYYAVWAKSSEAQSYTLVTSTDDLVAGQVYVIARTLTGSTVAMSTTQNNNNRGETSVMVEDTTLTTTGTIAELTLGGMTDAWTLYDPNASTAAGYLYSPSDSNNYLRTETELDENGYWTISVTDAGVAAITSNTHTLYSIRYNSSNSIFSCYPGTQQSVALYKKTSGGSSGSEWTTNPSQAAEHTVQWYNGATQLLANTAREGQKPTYTGTTPSKDRVNNVYYSFAGWSTDPNAAYGDAITAANLPAVTDQDPATIVYYAIFQEKTQDYNANISGSATVSVNSTSGLALTSGFRTIPEGGTFQITAVTWTVDDDTKASVTATTTPDLNTDLTNAPAAATLTPIAAGTVNVTVQYSFTYVDNTTGATSSVYTRSATQAVTISEDVVHESRGGYRLLTKANTTGVDEHYDFSGDYLIGARYSGSAQDVNNLRFLTPLWTAAGTASIETDSGSIMNNVSTISGVTETPTANTEVTGTISTYNSEYSQNGTTIKLKSSGTNTTTNSGTTYNVYDEITEVSDAMVFTIELVDETNGYYTIRIKNTDWYLANEQMTDKGNNSLTYTQVVTDGDTKPLWTISWNEGTYTDLGDNGQDQILIRSVYYSNRALMYNSNGNNAPRFANYGTNAFGGNFNRKRNDSGTQMSYQLLLFGNPNPFDAEIWYQDVERTLTTSVTIPADQTAAVELEGRLDPDIANYDDWNLISGPTWTKVSDTSGLIGLSGTGAVTLNGAAEGTIAIVQLSYVVQSTEEGSTPQTISTQTKIVVGPEGKTYATVPYAAGDTSNTGDYYVAASAGTLNLQAFVRDSENTVYTTGVTQPTDWAITATQSGSTSNYTLGASTGTLTWTAANIPSGGDILTITGTASMSGHTITTGTIRVHILPVNFTVTITKDGAAGDFTVAENETPTAINLVGTVTDGTNATSSSASSTIANTATYSFLTGKTGTWSIDETGTGATISQTGVLDISGMQRREDVTITVRFSNIGVQHTATNTDFNNLGDTIKVTVKALPASFVAEDDSYVLDFARSATLDVLANDYVKSGANVSIAVTDTNGYATVSGTSVVFTYPGQLTETYTFTYTGTDSVTGNTDEGTVTVKPGNTVYYEDSSSLFAYKDGTRGDWSLAGTADTTPQVPDDVFEYSESYASYATYSAGQTHKATVGNGTDYMPSYPLNLEKNGTNWPTVTFSFYGTGLDVMSVISNNSGIIRMQVYSGSTATGTPVASKTVNAYYGYTINETTGKAEATTGDNAMYQVPIVKWTAESATAANYTVVLTAMYLKSADKAGDGNYDLYFDAVRIHNPVDNTTTYKYVNFKSAVANAQTLGSLTGEATPTKTLSSIAVSGATSTFTVGDTFNYTGLVVTATYSDSTTATVTPTSVSTPDLSTAGTKEVTVTYTEGDVTKTATYNITVNAAAVTTNYTVSFESLTNETFEDQTVAEGSKATMPTPTVTPTISGATNVTFVGWVLNSVTYPNVEGSTVPDGYIAGGAQSGAITANTTFRPVYTYEISGSGSSDPVTTVSGLTSGSTYAIVTNRSSGNYKALTSDVGGNTRLAEWDTGVSSSSELTGVSYTANAQWVVTKTESGWTVVNGSNYLTYTAAKAASVSSSTYYLHVVDGTTGIYVRDNGDTAYLSLNATATNAYFAFYANIGQRPNLVFVPIGGGSTTHYYTTEIGSSSGSGSFAVGSNSVSVAVGASTTVAITLPSSTNSWWPDTSYSGWSTATVAYTDDSTLTITGVAAGTASLTVYCDDGSSEVISITVTGSSAPITSGMTKAEVTASYSNTKTVTGAGSRTVSGYANWGTRGELATFLTSKADNYYTGSYTYQNLMSNSNSPACTGTSTTESSALYSAIKTMLTAKHNGNYTSYDTCAKCCMLADCEAGNTGYVSALYSGRSLLAAEWDTTPDGWNREHTWPNSKCSGNSETDVIQIRADAKSSNSSRGNKAYGDSSGYYFPNTGDYDVRGDVARIMLYVWVQYGPSISESGTHYLFGTAGNDAFESLAIMKKWMEADPVDTWEMGRNDVVEQFGNTRNPFVDYPELFYALFNLTIPTGYQTPTHPNGYTAAQAADYGKTSMPSSVGTNYAVMDAEPVVATRAATRGTVGETETLSEVYATVFIDGYGNVESVENLANTGLPYELYLPSHSAIAFKVNDTNSTAFAIGAKAVQGATGFQVIQLTGENTGTLLKEQTLNTATEMFYGLDQQPTWSEGASGVIVIYNSGANTLCLTDLRTSSEATVSLTMNGAATRAARAAVRAMHAGSFTLSSGNDTPIIPIDGPMMTLTGYSLTLEGQIGINFYMTVPTALIGGGCYATLNGERVAFEEVTNGYRVTKRLAAKEMNDAVELKFFNASGEQLAFAVGSTDKTTDCFTYSVQDYLQYVKEHSGSYDAKLVALCEAMSAYGSYAQTYFKYGTGSAVGSDVAAAVNAVTIADDAYTYTYTANTANIAYYGESVVTESETAIRFYFSLPGDLSGYTVTVNGEEGKLVKNGSLYYVEVSNIAAKDLAKGNTVTVTYGEESLTIDGYSVYTYVKKTLGDPNADLVNAVKALKYYGDCAAEYFKEG